MEDGEEEEKGPKRRGNRTDPKVAQRLSQLDVEKNVLLTSEKWTDRIQQLNVEVTQSIESAKEFSQTKGFPGHDLVLFLLPIFFKHVF